MRKIAILASSLLIAACAQLPTGAGQSFTGGARFVLNGLSITPVKSFPQAAWRGLPAIRSGQDLYATRELATKYAIASRVAAQKGNMDLALLSWYASQQLANQGVSLLASTLVLVQSIGPNGDGTLPARGLAVLPATNTSLDIGGLATLQEELLHIAGSQAEDWDRGVQVAGGTDDVIREILSKPQATRQQYPGGGQSLAANELPLNTPVAIRGGLYVERRADVFVIYNSSDAPMTVPLSKIGYIPPMEAPSQARRAAAPYIRAISNSQFAYGNYLISKRPGFIHCEVQRPNRLGCVAPVPSVFFDQDGQLTSNSSLGADAYNRNTAYRNAVNTVITAARVPMREQFRTTCGNSPGYYFNERIHGPMAEIKKMYCTPAGNNSEGAITADLILGENGVVKTYGTLMAERETRVRMIKEVANANAWSDAVSYVPGIGSLEDGARCLGMETSLIKEVYFGMREQNLRMGAALAGWKPSPPDDQSIVSTALDCLGAVPLATTAAKGVKAGANVLRNQPALSTAASHAAELFDSFRKAMSATDAGKAYQALGTKIQNNPKAVEFVKGTFDLIQQGNDMAATVSGATHLLNQI